MVFRLMGPDGEMAAPISYKPKAPASEWMVFQLMGPDGEVATQSLTSPKRRRVNGWSRSESTRSRLGLVPARVLGQRETFEFTKLGP